MSWVSNSVCERKAEAPFSASSPFPCKLKSYRHQEMGCSNPFAPPVYQLEITFSSGKWHLFLTAKPCIRGNRARKASAEVGAVLPPGQAGAALTSSLLWGERTASRTAGLLPGGLCFLRRDKKGEEKTSHECPTAFTMAISCLCQAYVLFSTVFRLTRDIVHRCNFHKVTSHYVQSFAATNNLQSLGRKQTGDQEAHLT